MNSKKSFTGYGILLIQMKVIFVIVNGDTVVCPATLYAKIERGETKLNLHKLEQIANIFNIDVLELIKNDDKNVLFFMNDHNTNYYGSNENLTSEIDRLKLTISHKDELLKQRDLVIEQKDSEISALKEIISLLKSK